MDSLSQGKKPGGWERLDAVWKTVSNLRQKSGYHSDTSTIYAMSQFGGNAGD